MLTKKSFTSAQDYVREIGIRFAKNADTTYAARAKAYLRNQFDFFGIPTSQRRAIQKQFFSEFELPPFVQLAKITKLLWEKPQREFQYFALELTQKYKKQFSKKSIPLFEFMITHKSWWDTVDVVAPKLVAALFLNHPELIKENVWRWIKSDNIWLKRTALLFQLGYKEKTDQPLLFEVILDTTNHTDFFIRKAIGWALRQHARTNPAAVRKFVRANERKLSVLSYREAKKHL